ncbi:MOSC domain-containing protein [Colwellia sp. MSW7]|uniref:MOSC domain-containing protein n=1 Tax=Colwellia maritima TaxID=2912588 RepID=A0ABS9X0V1_9GAMM|nr:MOSC domain-containing protein [Colwellia maritima]MCI2283794.1 MOSC domain-containing protein [Colwellia maritima]
MTKQYYLKGVFRGTAESAYGLETAINKIRVEEPLYLFSEGLDGDQSADLRHHGGLERALHQYPFEHYAYWQQKYGVNNEWQTAGMGENISSIGMTEEIVCIGDRYQWGAAIIEVSQPRSPCFKLNKRWGIKNFSVAMQDISRCGWLYRVIQPGRVSVNEPLQLIEQVPNTMTLREVCDIFFGDPLNIEGLKKLKMQNKLSQSWMSKVTQRLETNEVENWHTRLLGPKK